MGRPKGSTNKKEVAVKRGRPKGFKVAKKAAVKASSPELASLAAKVLLNPQKATEKDIKALAASVLSQFEPAVQAESLLTVAEHTSTTYAVGIASNGHKKPKKAKAAPVEIYEDEDEVVSSDDSDEKVADMLG